ncbi:MAG: phosphodiester glycosidase family protein [Pyrinomonadaceae bacterium]
MVHFHKTTRLSQRSSTATSRVAQNAVKDRLLNGNRVLRFARVRILVSALGVLCALCGQSLAQEWKTVADGVEYAEVRREFSGKPVNINLLRLDLKKVRLDVHHAMDAAIGTEKTSSIATRHGAFAAINAGFFRLDTTIWAGDAAGALMTNSFALSESVSTRAALRIWNKPTETKVSVERIDLWVDLYVGNKLFSHVGINRERKSDEIVLFTSEFGRSTLTSLEGIEILADANWRIRPSKQTGSSLIPSGGFVISASGNKAKELSSAFKSANQISVFVSTYQPNSEPELTITRRFGRKYRLLDEFLLEQIVGGVPQLIKNSKIDITWEQEKSSKAFVETRHPRTAVAKLKDGKFLMLTADGRTEQSAGLDLYDLAAYFLELGATDAMNLDGGGSTTMFLEGKVVNKPSDKEGERKVGDALLVTLRKSRSSKQK